MISIINLNGERIDGAEISLLSEIYDGVYTQYVLDFLDKFKGANFVIHCYNDMIEILVQPKNLYSKKYSCCIMGCSFTKPVAL